MDFKDQDSKPNRWQPEGHVSEKLTIKYLINCKGLCFRNNGKYQLQTTVHAGNCKLQFVQILKIGFVKKS